MRGTISDQDLTDYALNELPPEERLYLESMLAVSVECRNDVYENIELAQMLEEAFDDEDQAASACALSDSQRDRLVQFRAPAPIWECAAAVLGLAAATAFLLTNPAFWQMDDAAGKVAQVSIQMSKIVAGALAPEKINFAAPLANLAAFTEDSAGWGPASSELFDPVVCTPPSGSEYRFASVPSESAR